MSETAEIVLPAIKTGLCTQGFESLCLEAIDHSGLGIAFEVILLTFAFFALALLCDEYLVPAIECLCRRFAVKEDIAGALFIAMGSSAPEIIINAVSAARGTDDSVELGIGAVIGSGVIAFALIPAIVTLFSPTYPVEVKRRPLFRDISFYFISMILVIIFIHDGEVTLLEAGILCSFYLIYLTVVILSPKIRLHYQLGKLATNEEKQQLLLKRSVSFVDLVKQQKQDDLRDKINAAHTFYAANKDSNAGTPALKKPLSILAEEEEEDLPTPTSVEVPSLPRTFEELDEGLEPLRYQGMYNTFNQTSSGAQSTLPPSFHPLLKFNDTDSLHAALTPTSTSKPDEFKTPKKQNTPIHLIDDVDDLDGSDDTFCDNPLTNAIFPLFTTPLAYLFAATIPAAKPHTDKEHLYPASFIISFLYLAFFSMLISAVFSRWTELSGMGGDFFGLLMVSAAAELPDLIQSITSAKNGYSSMAMACLASQIANILIGFGLSWFVSILVRGVPLKVSGAAKLTRSAMVQLANVIFFTIITVGFALYYKTNKVHMVPFKAHLLLVAYAVSILCFALFAIAY